MRIAHIARPRHTARILLCLIFSGLASGCFKSRGAVDLEGLSAIVLVTNRGFYDVNIYAIRSVGVSGHRLATVAGGTTVTVRVPESDQQPGNGVMLNLRAVGSRLSWTTPLITFNPGSVARLDIASSSGGDLSQSQFYLIPTPRPEPPDKPVSEAVLARP